MFNTAKFAFMFIQHFIWCSLQVRDSSEKNENSQIGLLCKMIGVEENQDYTRARIHAIFTRLSLGSGF